MKIKIEKLDHFGRGICYVDGKICFVEDTLEGEEVAASKFNLFLYNSVTTIFIESVPISILA